MSRVNLVEGWFLLWLWLWLLLRQPLLLGQCGQAPVLGPQAAIAQPGGRQEVSIDMADPPTHQLVALGQQLQASP